jgi:hypothetical protein
MGGPLKAGFAGVGKHNTPVSTRDTGTDRPKSGSKL